MNFGHLQQSFLDEERGGKQSMRSIQVWEDKSTVRNRSRRLLILDDRKYFFPAMEQPLCLHPLVQNLGEEAKKYILIQSGYLFMKNILSIETEVVTEIVNKIIQSKPKIQFPEGIRHSLLTVMIDETYHAYVANDFIQQLSIATGIHPIQTTQQSSLSRALLSTTQSLPSEYRILFEVIAVCIAENSITQELAQIKQDPEVNPFFNEINSDHIMDEARHAGIFNEVLTFLWRELSEEDKDIIGPLLPSFICEYLRPDMQVQNDRDILSQLNLSADEAEEILYDTHPAYDFKTLHLRNPIVRNTLNLLTRCGVLSHRNTSLAFNKLGGGVALDPGTEHWTTVIQDLSLKQDSTSWKLEFLLEPRTQLYTTQVRVQSISLGSNCLPYEGCGLFLSYIHELSQQDQISFSFKTKSPSGQIVCVPVMSSLPQDIGIGEFVRQVESNLSKSQALSSKFEDAISKSSLSTGANHWDEKIPMLIDMTETFTEGKASPHVLQLHIFRGLEDQLQFSLYFDSSYYQINRVRDLLENFSYYSMTAIGDRSILRSKMPLISPKQLKKLLRQPPQDSIEKQSSTIIDLFAHQVQVNPNHLAILDQNRAFTYQEIARMSDCVAAYLLNKDLKKGAIIAIMHGYGYAYIPLVLGIMKAGMVFLSLPEDGPVARLRTILDEADVRFLIVDQEQHCLDLGGDYPWILSADILSQGAGLNRVHLKQVRTHTESLDPESLACILFTSGSTGRPKGVMIKHSALGHFAKSATSTFALTSKDRLLQFSIHSFDASLAEISNALASGATLCIRPARMLDSSLQFFSECERLEISVLNLPTPLWTQLVQDLVAFSLPLPSKLTTVLIYGDKVTSENLDLWYQNAPRHIELINTYGPTETTIAASTCNLRHHPVLRTCWSLIGQSLGDAQLYVLDRSRRFLPLGVVGELYIGGPGVSPGYFKDPSLTALRFLTHIGLPSEAVPSSSGPFYKTGDKVLWLERGIQEEGDQETKGGDGECKESENQGNENQENILAFVGRNDRQVKIRGHRVELGEIEYALNLHPEVDTSLVIYRGDISHHSLVAFVIPKRSKVISLEELRLHAQRYLPVSMQPSFIQLLEKWPMTPRGKIDKSSLLNLIPSALISGQFENQVDTKLAKIWQEVLATNDIHPRSHFFHLGGHSLLAMRLVARINHEFKSNITLRHILENPCFSQMATFIKESDQQLLPLRVLPGDMHPGSLNLAPLSFAQESMWLIDRLQSGRSIQYNIAYAIRFSGAMSESALEKSLNHILERHTILRSVFQKDETQIVQRVIEKEIQLRSELVTLADFGSIALREARTPFDLTLEPPLHFRLFKITDTFQYILLINHHHIIHDGFSIGIFMNELRTFYEAFYDDRVPHATPVAHQYLEFAKAQRASPEKGPSNSLSYWCKQLEGYRPLLLPFRKEQGRLNPSAGDEYRFSIEPELAGALRNICAREGCTLFTGLLAILTLLFHRYSKMNEIAVGSIMSTRTYQGDEHLMGMFINAVILRNWVKSSDTFSILLQRVKKTLFEATTHRFTTLESITRSTRIARMPNDSTLFDIVVAFHSFEQNLTVFNSNSCKGKIEFIDNKTAKFGMTLDIFDNGGPLLVRIEYCTELYDRDSIKILAKDFLTLINESSH